MKATALSDRLRARLVCPRDKTLLADADDALVCPRGHRYPCVDGIPILVVDDVEQTHWIARYSLDHQDVGADVAVTAGDAIDPYIRRAIGATCGNLYGPGFARRMTRYPIPAMPLQPRRGGETLLDVGCNWGRWVFAAARAGFTAVGIDPSLEGVRAARRVASQLNVPTEFVVGDARYLPFADGTFDNVFSYSVLQHFAPKDVVATASEMRRVAVSDGRVVVQMAALYGVRSLMQLARRGFRAGREFEVRYWRPAELRRAFERAIGPTHLEADSYLSLNAQPEDLPLLAPADRVIVRLSDWLRRASRSAPALVELADSIYVHSEVAGK